MSARPGALLKRAYFHVACRTMMPPMWWDDALTYREKSRYPLTWQELGGVQEIINAALKRLENPNA